MVNEFEQEREFECKMKQLTRKTLFEMIIFSSLVIAIGGYGLYFANKDQNIESCRQYAEQQQYSSDWCSNDCFRDNYLRLQQKCRVDDCFRWGTYPAACCDWVFDLNLAYRITINKCNIGE